MFARFFRTRKSIGAVFAFMSMGWLAACDVTLDPNANVGPQIDPEEPVQVALLVPGGSGTGSDAFLAQNLENAARLAIADLNGPEINLRVYNTGGDATIAATAAKQAADEGAQIIIGPLFQSAAVAAGVAVADQNINVLAFSNNPTIAGGNVFVLGATFENTANRIVQYGTRQGLSRYHVVHADDPAGAIGRDAIAAAVQNNGGQLVGTSSYGFSQQAIYSSSRQIAQEIRSSGANAVFLTGNPAGDLGIIGTTLPESGINPASTRYLGLTRWDSVPQIADLPGLQGGLFAMPDVGRATLFANRYAAAFGEQPHPLAGLAYDGIAAIGALVQTGSGNALTKAALTQPQGFQGTAGVFRLLPNGLNERALSIATFENNQVVILEQAPRSFGGAGL